MKKEESKLKGDVEKSKRELQAAQQRFSANKSEIGQLQLKISSLKEDQRQVTSSLSLYSGSNSTSALSGTLMGAGNDMTDDGHSKIETDAFSAVATVSNNSTIHVSTKNDSVFSRHTVSSFFFLLGR